MYLKDQYLKSSSALRPNSLNGREINMGNSVLHLGMVYVARPKLQTHVSAFSKAHCAGSLLHLLLQLRTLCVTSHLISGVAWYRLCTLRGLV